MKSLRLSWQTRTGKWSLAAAALMGLLLILIVLTEGDLPQTDEWLEATAQEVSQSTRPMQTRTILTVISPSNVKSSLNRRAGLSEPPP